jgi:hypothetical protein
MVSKLLNKYWPGVTGKLDKRQDGMWMTCIQPGMWTLLGRTEAEITAYLSSHPLTGKQQMKDFEKSLLDLIGMGGSGQTLDEVFGHKSQAPQRPDARVRITCKCGTRFTVLIPQTLIRTWQTHKCTNCSRNFKTHYFEPPVGKGWMVYGEGTLCDKCHNVPPVKTVLSAPVGHPQCKKFHLCQDCFDKENQKSKGMPGYKP